MSEEKIVLAPMPEAFWDDPAHTDYWETEKALVEAVQRYIRVSREAGLDTPEDQIVAIVRNAVAAVDTDLQFVKGHYRPRSLVAGHWRTPPS